MLARVANIMSVACVGLFACAVTGCQSEAVAPTSFAKFTIEGENSMNLEYPEGWSADGGGKGNYWGRFTGSGAEMRFQTDISGSLMADAGGSAMPFVTPDGKVIQPEHPVEKLHKMGKDKVAEEFTNYEEEPAPDKFTNGLGEGRKSEFLADGGLGGGKIHGYRVTLLSNDRRFTIICTCPHSDWKTLRPAFDRMIDSMRRGKAS